MKNILLGFTGSVASTLSVKMCKSFLDKYNVKVVITEASRQFVDIEAIKALKVDVLSDADEFYPYIVYYSYMGETDVYRRADPYKKNDPILHIELRDWADCFLIAPCSANTIAKIANGYCDNLLTSIAMAWDFSLQKKSPCNSYKKIVLAPAMNCKMWSHPVTSEHIEKISNWGIWVVNPVDKKLACGETGVGAMADIKYIGSIVNRAMRL